jgi:hypothetical protein
VAEQPTTALQRQRQLQRLAAGGSSSQHAAQQEQLLQQQQQQHLGSSATSSAVAGFAPVTANPASISIAATAHASGKPGTGPADWSCRPARQRERTPDNSSSSSGYSSRCLYACGC